jgi:hypothetical protein
MLPRATSGYPPIYALSTLFFILALAGVVVLVATDVLHHYDVSLLHQHLDSVPLTMIGLSCITMHLGSNCNRAEKLKGVFLGIAFLLWGGEQLIPPSRLATFMDEGAVAIFVIDVSFVIWSRLSLRDLSSVP